VMQLISQAHGNTIVVQVDATRIDASVAIQFKDRMREVTDAGTQRLVLDLASVDFLDSSGLGALVAVMKYAGKERQFELAGLSPSVAKVMQLTCLDRVFVIFATASDALASDSDAV
jgi:anti-sigma B factor antagonist